MPQVLAQCPKLLVYHPEDYTTVIFVVSYCPIADAITSKQPNVRCSNIDNVINTGMCQEENGSQDRPGKPRQS